MCVKYFKLPLIEALGKFSVQCACCWVCHQLQWSHVLPFVYAFDSSIIFAVDCSRSVDSSSTYNIPHLFHFTDVLLISLRHRCQSIWKPGDVQLLSSSPHFLRSPSLPSFPLPIPFPLPFLLPRSPPPKPVRGSGERCKLPSGVWGEAPADKRFGTYLGQKEQPDICGHHRANSGCPDTVDADGLTPMPYSRSCLMFIYNSFLLFVYCWWRTRAVSAIVRFFVGVIVKWRELLRDWNSNCNFTMRYEMHNARSKVEGHRKLTQ